MRISALFAALTLAAVSVPAIAYADPAGPAPAVASGQTAPMQSAAPAQMAAAAPAADVSARDQIVCKMTPPPTGSRLGGQRECHTQAQWDERMKENQDQVTREQNTPLGGGMGK